MNKITLFLTVTFLTFMFSSCDTFVNLGDSEKGSVGGEDYLPEELSDDEKKESDYGNSSDAGNTGNTGNTEGMSDTGNSGNTGDSGNTGNSGNTDTTEISDEDASSLNGYPFADDFTNDMCSCGSTPEYAPVCCTGNISVYNACFANCYAINSSGAICASYSFGICGSVKQPDSDNELTDDSDIIDPTDSDEDIVNSIDDDSVSDDDIPEYVIDNECGCYPENTSFNCCYVNGTVLISTCLAECHCKGGYSNCF